MRIFQFIGWWWSQRDGGERIWTVFLTWCAVWLVASFWLGELAFNLAFVGLVVVLGGFLALLVIAGVINGVSILVENWKRFSKENPPKDVQIINKLKGIDSNTNV